LLTGICPYFFGFASIWLDGRAKQTNHWHWLFFAFLFCRLSEGTVGFPSALILFFHFLGKLIDALRTGMVADHSLWFLLYFLVLPAFCLTKEPSKQTVGVGSFLVFYCVLCSCNDMEAGMTRPPLCFAVFFVQLIG